MTIEKDTQITSLTTTNTFYDWWTKENDEIIAKLNLMKVFGLTAGEGITVFGATSGTWTISIGGTLPITTGLTFSGDVNFTGNASLKNISFKVTGITSGTSGFTFGTPVYYESSINGYTASKANDPDTAEMVGLISRMTSDFSEITVVGKIDGTFGSVSGNLSPGCVYFIDDTVLGGLTTEEPTTTGRVSKPALYALGATSGIVLQHRGNYLNSNVGGGGATANNRIFVSMTDADASSVGITAERAISYNPNVSSSTLTSYLSSNGSRQHRNGWFLSRASTSLNFFGGSEEDYVVGVIVDSISSGGNTIFEIATGGDVVGSLGGGALGVYYLTEWTSASDQLQTSSTANGESGRLIAIQYDASKFTVLNTPRKAIATPGAQFASLLGPSGASASTSGGSGVLEQSSVNNILINGDFSIWQRTIGKSTGYTATGNVSFADMWRRTDGITSSASKSYLIERKEFSDYQNSVEGNPQYYLDVKCIGSTYATNDSATIGHVIPTAKALNDGTVTLSFYAKCSTAGYLISPYYARYNNGIREDFERLSENYLTTQWTRIDVKFTIPMIDNYGVDRENDYTEVGIDLFPITRSIVANGSPISTDATVSIASMCLINGQPTLFDHVHDRIEDRLQHCRRYYYTSYPLENKPGDTTMRTNTKSDFSAHTHITLPTQYCNVVRFPVEMRITPTISIYSPHQGTSNDAYNETASLVGSNPRNCSESGGIPGYNNKNRYVPDGSTIISTAATSTGLEVCVNYGAVEYDRVYYHIVADADFPLPS